MDHLDNKNTLVISIAIAIVLVAAAIGITVASNVASANTAKIAVACVEAGGTWLDTTDDCISR